MFPPLSVELKGPVSRANPESMAEVMGCHSLIVFCYVRLLLADTLWRHRPLCWTSKAFHVAGS